MKTPALISLPVCLLLASGCLFEPGPPVCSPANCAGCCDWQGQCRSGRGPSLCGAHGETCQMCVSGAGGGGGLWDGGGFGGGEGFGGGQGFGGGGAGGQCVAIDGGAGFGEPFVSTVHQPAPVTGGTVAVVDDAHVVVMDADRDGVWTVDLSNGTASRIALPPGSRPARAVVDAKGRVHVVLRGTAQVAHVDARAGVLLGTDALPCLEPRGIDLHAATQDLVVACREGELVRFQPGGAQTVSVVAERDVRDVLVSGDQVTLTTFRAASLSTYAGFDGGAPVARGPAPLPDHQPEVAWRTIATATGPLMVHQSALTSSISTTACPPGTVASSGGGAYGSSPPTGPVPDACGPGAMGSALYWESPVGPLTFGIPDVLPVDVAARPVDPVCRPPFCTNAQYVAVAGAGGSASLYFISPGSPSPVPGGGGCLQPTVRFGGNFTGVAFLPSGLAVLHERARSTVTVVEPAMGTVVWQMQYATDSVDNDGSRLFHRVPTGGAAITCASCHPEGGEDGHTWVLDGQPRRTQSLQGGVTSRAPFHWTGALPSLDALMGDTFVSRMGGSRPPQPVVDSLGQWLDTLPTPRASPSADPSRLARGRAAFEKAGCDGCHSGPQLSDHRVTSVGTGGDFKTPSLVGVHARGPWMHNGCARTLRERFTIDACGGGVAHGDAAGLDAGELDDLLGYLESL